MSEFWNDLQIWTEKHICVKKTHVVIDNAHFERPLHKQHEWDIKSSFSKKGNLENGKI